MVDMRKAADAAAKLIKRKATEPQAVIYGTVTSVPLSTGGTVLVALDDAPQGGSIKVWPTCMVRPGDKVIIVKKGTQWLAIGNLTKPEVEIPTPLPITQGGTGATTVTQALTNLGLQVSTKYTYRSIPIGFSYAPIFERIDNLVVCSQYARGNGYYAVTDWTNLVETIPVGYRPLATGAAANSDVVIQGNSATNCVVIKVIAGSGALRWYNWNTPASGSLGMYFTAAWYTNDSWPT
jgi:hypothetical protein